MTSPEFSPLTERQPQEIIAFQAGAQISVGQFLQRAVFLSRKLPKHRFVTNLLTDRYHYLLGFCAAIIAGQCTLMPPNRLKSTLNQLRQQYADGYLLDESELQVLLGDQQIDQAAEFNGSAPMVPDEQLCAIAFTSGSTGKPTPNLKFWNTLRVSSIGNADLLLEDLSDQQNMVGTISPQHMWGLETSILLPLFARVAISNHAPFFPQDIADALESIPAPRVLVSSPAHLRVLLRSGVQLVKISRIFSATAPVSKQLAQQVEQHFDTELLEIFGSSESGILARRRTADDSLWQLSPLFELETGLDHTLVSADHLPATIVLHDSIERMGKGRFKWLGRHQDMIKIAGKRGSLADLNHRLLAIEGVHDGVIFSPESESERLVAMVVAPGLRPADIIASLKSQLEPVFLPRPIFMVASLPRQATGKLTNEDLKKLHQKLVMNTVNKHQT